MIRLLFSFGGAQISRYFRTRKIAKAVTILLFLLMFAGIATAVFFFFRRGLLFFIGDEYFQDALLLYVYEIYFLIIAILVFISSAVAGLFQLFTGRNNNWIMASPQYSFMVRRVFVQILVSLFWPLIILVLPGVLAIYLTLNVNAWGMLLSLVSAGLLLILTVELALLWILASSRILLFLQDRFKGICLSVTRIAGVSSVFIVIVFIALWRALSSISFISLAELKSETATELLSAVVGQFWFLPTHLPAMSLYSFGNGEVLPMIFYSVILGGLVLIAGLFLKGASRWHLGLWQSLQEGTSVMTEKGKPGYQVKSQVFGRLILKASSPMRAFWGKEAVMMFRNLKNISWLGFSVALWLIYSGLNAVLSAHVVGFSGRYEIFASLIPALQFMTIVYFVSALALRFAFPSFSQEGKTGWIIMSSPVSLVEIFLVKAMYFTVVFIIIGMVIALINSLILNFSLLFTGVSILLFVTAIALITTLAISVGAIFPNFETDDPEILSTSLPGLSFIAGALLYGAVGTFVLFGFYSTGEITPVILFELFSIFAIMAWLYLGSRSLRSMEMVNVLE